MNVRSILLAAGSALVLAGLVALMMAVEGEPELDIPETALAQAQQHYERTHATPTAPANPGLAAANPGRRDTSRTTGSTTKRPEPTPSPPARSNPRNDPGSDPNPTPPTLPPAPPDQDDGGATLKELMDIANRYYDHGEYELAVEQALSILAEHPRNVRMMRIMVSAGCMMGAEDQARQYFPLLPENAKRVMRIRCGRYGIEL